MSTTVLPEADRPPQFAWEEPSPEPPAASTEEARPAVEAYSRASVRALGHSAEAARDMYRLVLRTTRAMQPAGGSGFSTCPVEAVHVTPQAEAFRSAYAAISRARRLPADWDTYGSLPVTSRAALAAGRVVGLAEAFGFDAPRVGPVSGGGLQLEWSKGSRGLEIYVGPKDGLSFVRDDNGSVTEGDINPETQFKHLKDLLDWVHDRS